jgi:hypothetical protein
MNADTTEDPTPENRLKTAHDDQTDKVFLIKPETKWATFVACISASYLISALAFLLWLLLDTWSGRNQLLSHFGYTKDLFDHESFRLMAYVAIAGALGATVDGIRSIVSWHSEREAYGPRFIWKDLSLPFVGAALGLIVYVTVRGGAGVLNGNFSLDQTGSMPKVSAFAVSALAGFSCWQVFRWLDAKANQLFSVVKDDATATAKKAKVPDLTGKTVDEATTLLTSSNLKLGSTNKEVNSEQVGRVTQQTPAPGSLITGGDPVDITIGVTAA